MGCVQSKKDSGDIHPNVFRVVNIDEGGAGLWSGQLEVTDAELVLYREGRDATVWPLRCLRRYGFDGEIFSFESGRRCATGEGIYAFRCRRAGMLFRTLQQNIQLRNLVSESLPFQLPPNTIPITAASLQRNNTGEAASARAHSITDETIEADVTVTPEVRPPPANPRPASTTTHTPHSPSNTEILEVLPLFPLTEANANHITNLYQKPDFRMREYNNNRADANVEHSYCNDFNRDLAALRTTLKRENVLDTIKDMEEETNFLKCEYMNEGIPLSINPPLSPAISDTSEHYARLSVENGNRTYMNLGPHDASVQQAMRSDTHIIVHNSFLASGKKDNKHQLSQVKEEINTYANVDIGNVLQQLRFKIPRQKYLSDTHKYSDSDAFMSMSPVEEQEVNYAILDIECKEDKGTPVSPDSCSSSRNDSTTSPPSSKSKLVSQLSIEKTSSIASSSSKAPNTTLGYTTIDFDKTVALTSVASGAEVDTDGSRKTRHNSVNIVSGLNGTDKNKLI